MSLIIPADVQYYILGFLSRDPHALCLCAQVCRAWLHYSRLYLFRRVDPNTFTAFDNLARLAIGSSHLQEYFYYTQELVLRSNDELRASRKGLENTATLTAPRQWAHVATLFFPPRMSNLACIEYFCVDWTKIPIHPSFYMCISKLVSVNRLKLSGCKFPSFTDVQRLVRALPKVYTLDLYGVTWDKDIPDAARKGHPYITKPRLSSLTIRSVSRTNFVSIVQWINDTPSRDFIHVLGCLCDDRDRSTTGVDTTKLLQVLGPSLEDLSLDLTHWEFTESGVFLFSAYNNFSVHTFLDCLHMSRYIRSSNTHLQYKFAFTLHLLPYCHGSYTFASSRS